MKKKSRVSLVKVLPQAMESVIFSAVSRAIELIGGPDTYAKKGQTVLVNPNIASPNSIECGSSIVTWAVAKIFSDHGCRVQVGEDPSIPTNEEFAYREYGLKEVAERANAELVSLRKGPHSKVKVPEGGYFEELEVSDYALEADLLVSVPVMKTVNVTTVTLGLKNLKGVIPSVQKRKFHTDGLNQGIADLNRVLKSKLVVVDATYGKDFSNKRAFPVGLVIASNDLVAGDSVCSRIMGFNPYSIEHIRRSENAGIGHVDLKSIEIFGEQLDDHLGKWKFPHPRNPFDLAEESRGGIEIIQGEPCSVCLNELGDSLHMLKDKLSDFRDVAILVGPHAHAADIPESKTTIYYGNCLKKHCQHEDGTFIKGCPPTEYGYAETGSIVKALESILKKQKRS